MSETKEKVISEKMQTESEADEDIYISVRHKIRMNRFFREQIGWKYLPHPEVDTPYERLRSRCVICIEKTKSFINGKRF